ncbi:MAG: SUMF1/EgtB/PvdO family nonheme iron enzyme, partial [Lentisphaeria bacterium]|nr:SUMF1/EgtB/PvdO family nonheme iron enzyme [Lentisphaeria bacterium]
MALQGTYLDRQEPFAGMVKLPAATFQMGKPEGYMDSFVNDAPLHEVTLSHDFWIGRYPVTERF